MGVAQTGHRGATTGIEVTITVFVDDINTITAGSNWQLALN
jgi:hypothetical protein